MRIELACTRDGCSWVDEADNVNRAGYLSRLHDTHCVALRDEQLADVPRRRAEVATWLRTLEIDISEVLDDYRCVVTGFQGSIERRMTYTSLVLPDHQLVTQAVRVSPSWVESRIKYAVELHGAIADPPGWDDRAMHWNASLYISLGRGHTAAVLG